MIASGGEDCLRCSARGRITCPTCKGSGNLQKTCPTCNGKGRKPCPTCTNKAHGTPGHLRCPVCKGRGTSLADPSSRCYRCRGTRQVSCSVCFGKGSLTCPETRYDRTCPTCKFVKRVKCPDCRGDGKVSPEERSAQESASRLPSSKDPRSRSDPSTRRDRPSTRESSPATRSGRPTPTTKTQAAKERAEMHRVVLGLWKRFNGEYEELRPLFLDRWESEIRQAESLLRQLQRSASSEVEARKPGALELVAEIEKAQKNLEKSRDNWAKLFEQYEELDKYHRRISKLGMDQSSVSLDLASASIEEEVYKLSYIKTTLSQTAAVIGAIRREKPAQLASEVKELKPALMGYAIKLQKLKSTPDPNGSSPPQLSSATRSRSDRSSSDRSIFNPVRRPTSPQGITVTNPGEATLVSRPYPAPLDPQRATSQRRVDPPLTPAPSASEEPGIDEPDTFVEDLPSGSGHRILALLALLVIGACGGIFVIYRKRELAEFRPHQLVPRNEDQL